MNKEIFERLKKYEVHLRRGYKGNYVFGLYRKDFDELLEIYKELGGREHIVYTCSNCQLRLTKFLGKLYYEYVPPVVEETEKETTEEQLPKETTEEPLPKKEKEEKRGKKRTVRKSKSKKKESH